MLLALWSSACSAMPSASTRGALEPLRLVASLSPSDYHLHTGSLVAAAPENVTALSMPPGVRNRRPVRLRADFLASRPEGFPGTGSICEKATEYTCDHYDCNASSTCHDLGDVCAAARACRVHTLTVYRP